MRFWTGTALAAATLAACVPQPELRIGTGSDLGEARALLSAAAEAGPVPLRIAGAPGQLAEGEIAELAGRGVSGLDVEFEPLAGPIAGPNLVLAFDPPLDATGERLCESPPTSAPARAPLRLRAVFCVGDDAVAEVEGQAREVSPEASRRLVWQAANRLFPDDYPETYGVNILGGRAGVGGSVGF